MLLDNSFSDITEKVIGCAMQVHLELGSGFPELIYQRGLAIELAAVGMTFQGEASLSVFCKNTVIGSRRTDFLVAGQVLVALKAVSELADAHYAQIINYSKACRLEVALPINFGEPSLKFKRLLYNPPRLAYQAQNPQN